MSEALANYRRLEDKLVHVRWVHRGLESVEEDECLEEMDAAWSQLSSEEQAEVSATPSRTLLRVGPVEPVAGGDEDVLSYPVLPPRRKEVA